LYILPLDRGFYGRLKQPPIATIGILRFYMQAAGRKKWSCLEQVLVVLY